MILSLHNIAFYKKMMCDIRESIINKKFYELKENILKIMKIQNLGMDPSLRFKIHQIILFWIR